MVHKSHLILTGLITSTLLLSGCSDPLVTLDNMIANKQNTNVNRFSTPDYHANNHVIANHQDSQSNANPNHGENAGNQSNLNSSNQNPAESSSSSAPTNVYAGLSHRQIQFPLKSGEPIHEDLNKIAPRFRASQRVTDTLEDIQDQQGATQAQLHLIVTYFENHHTQDDENQFSAIIDPIIFLTSRQAHDAGVGSINHPSNNLDAAILFANKAWPTFLNDYRDDPRKLTYLRLTNGLDTAANDTMHSHLPNTINFTPKVANEAINHIFKFYPETSKFSPDQKIYDPRTAEPMAMTSQVQRQIQTKLVAKEQKPNSNVMQGKRWLDRRYQKTLRMQRHLHVDTAKHLDQDPQRAFDIFNWYVAFRLNHTDQMHVINKDLERPIVENVLTKHYHFGPRAVEEVIEVVPAVDQQTIDWANYQAAKQSLYQ